LLGSEGEVVTLDDPADPSLKVLPFKVHAMGPVSTRFGYTARLIPWLVTERDRFDGVVLHGLWQYLSFAVRRAIASHKPYLVFTHGMLDPYFKHAYPMKHLKKSTYWLLNEYWVLHHANRVLFTSDAEAHDARISFWPSEWNASVVPYGASAPEGEPETLRREFLAHHPALLKPDGTGHAFLLFLGRIHAKKGCDLLLEAFAQIARRTPELHLVFAGPDKAGPTASKNLILKDKLISQATANGINHRVHWTGMLDNEQKWGAFYACEAFCLPSHQENFGIAVAEALACGKPVLISDKVNIWPEILNDGAALVGPDTAVGTLQTLEQWIALSPEEKSAMGKHAFDCFRRRYDMQVNASGILEIFRQAIATPAPVPAALSKRKASAHYAITEAPVPPDGRGLATENTTGLRRPRSG
jgi:glycosyltransferase involved in cell wall biosynthesis